MIVGAIGATLLFTQILHVINRVGCNVLLLSHIGGVVRRTSTEDVVVALFRVAITRGEIVKVRATDWSLDHDVPRAVGFGLATSRKCTSKE